MLNNIDPIIGMEEINRLLERKEMTAQLLQERAEALYSAWMEVYPAHEFVSMMRMKCLPRHEEEVARVIGEYWRLTNAYGEDLDKEYAGYCRVHCPTCGDRVYGFAPLATIARWTELLSALQRPEAIEDCLTDRYIPLQLPTRG